MKRLSREANTSAQVVEGRERCTQAAGVDDGEGAGQVHGTRAGQVAAGHGYLELTGYGEALSALPER